MDFPLLFPFSLKLSSPLPNQHITLQSKHKHVKNDYSVCRFKLALRRNWWLCRALSFIDRGTSFMFNAPIFPTWQILFLGCSLCVTKKEICWIFRHPNSLFGYLCVHEKHTRPFVITNSSTRKVSIFHWRKQKTKNRKMFFVFRVS